MGNLNLKKVYSGATGKFKSDGKDSVVVQTKENLQEMNRLLTLLYAEAKHSLLIILHGIDASGKDGTVQHIFSGANPQGVNVHSFKQPSEVELKHDFLWRCHSVAPESGKVAIFNRSYYEEVTTVKVHPEFLKQEHLPKSVAHQKDFFLQRYEQINNFEKMLTENGTLVLKFFLHISKKEQQARLQDRLRDPTKNWKFSEADLKERRQWKKYQETFQEMLDFSDTKHAPWFVIPADKKWYRNYLVSESIVKALSQLKMKYPKI